MAILSTCMICITIQTKVKAFWVPTVINWTAPRRSRGFILLFYLKTQTRNRTKNHFSCSKSPIPTQLTLVIQTKHYEKVDKHYRPVPSKSLVKRIPKLPLNVSFSLSPSLAPLSLPKMEASTKRKIPRSSVLTQVSRG